MRLLCKRGLHDLDDPENVYVQPSNGTRHCKPCMLARNRGELDAYKMCWRGLHDLSDPANVYVKPDGQRQCRPCAREQQRAYRAAKKAKGS